MPVDVKRIASRLRSSVEQVALPLDAAERVQVSMRASNEITSDDCIQLGGCPQVASLWRDAQFVAQVGTDPLRQLGWKPSQDRVCSAVGVCDVLWPWSHCIVLNHVVAHGWRDDMIRIRQKASWFEQMYINILPTTLASSNSLSSM
jgi:hypothetical protein